MPIVGAEGEWEPRFRLSGRAALWLPVIVSFVVQVPATVWLARTAWMRGTGSGGGGGWVADAVDVLGSDGAAVFGLRIAVAVAGPVVLLFARRYPGPAVAAVTALAGASVLLTAGSPAPPYAALAFAVVGAAVRGARVWAWISLAAGWTATLGIGIVLGLPWQPAPVVVVTLVLVLLVVMGESIRSRRARFDETRRRLAERRMSAAQAERVRIARELHDVLAHSLSQINVQAGVGLHLIDRDPEQGRAALANIKEASKSALDEVRSVLGMLRDDGSAGPAPLVPEPGLAQVGALVAGVRGQGVEVTLDVEAPAGAVTQAVQLAAYRIVQESLTNVVRHAGPGAVARVGVSVAGGMLVVEVTDDGATGAVARAGRGADGAGAGAEPASGGRGIIGMRERAELLGGRLEAGPRPGGGFSVTARLPLVGAGGTGGVA